MNTISICGRLTKPIELKQQKNGAYYTKITVASNYYQSKEVKTSFINVTVFGQKASYLHEKLKDKGRVYIQGILQTSSYEDKQGNKKYSFDVLANEIQVIDYKETKNENNTEQNVDLPQDFVYPEEY
ncbi:single-stranded DNA-binding protein [Gemella sp. GH3]|uniref:single-stranded DNA-binding protein n=1 Tax=unclassified Gemella TaxID=2624949 RepID=UPI0015D03C59|nr:MULTISPECIES: single-stranded DNA-binding protein [unclassified Gemella]MBF0714104.1 single-stranded DNA-binding protein [Gemella sp. GH3.1]NYS51056.1 single-stranded DNA-binding protein [Gemella sp. GH3]